MIVVEPRELLKRRISEETCKKFNYGVGEDRGKIVQAATYTDGTGRPVAQKVRTADKDFYWTGEPKKALLFGQHLWRDKGRRVVVTEGEIDALSYAEATGRKWPVVSVPNGAQGAARAVASQLEWLDGFDEVVLMFDQDEPGQAAAAECAEMLPPGKARICSLPRKDANEVLIELGAGELAKLPWDARPYRPNGIVDGRELWDLVSDTEVAPSIQYPWLQLNDLTHGFRRGEIVTLCAGSGIGKSTACREIAYHLIGLQETVGYIALEETTKRTALGLMSVELEKPLHLEEEEDKDILRAAFDATVGSGHLYLYDSWGSCESEHLVRKIRALVRACGVSWVILDHVSIVVSGLEIDNERKVLDITMTKLRSLAEELGIGIFVVSHLKRVQGRAFEKGGEVQLSDLRGTAAIEQLSDIVIGLERDQQSDRHGNVMKIRVLKNRFSGETGVAGHLKYDRATGRLVDCDDPFPTEQGDDDAGEF
jgi:twinkle protein